jgi:flagellar biosynthesis/type III secretory pathway protein FliH
MLHLTPLEQTTAVRQLMAKSLQQGLDQGLTKGVKQGLAKGVKQGREQGELIGKIQLAQRVLKCQVTPKTQLCRRSLSDLKQLLKELESQL